MLILYKIIDFYQSKRAISVLKLSGSTREKFGQHEEALDTAEQAVEIRRTLAAAQPDTYLPDLTMSLHTMAIRLSELGRHREALDTAEQAVEMSRKLAAAQPDAFCVELSRSLGTKTIVLIGLEQKAEALTTLAEAMAILRPYFLDAPAPFADLMKFHLQHYIQLSQQLESEPDAELLGPIIELFQHMDSADDNAE